MELNYDVLPGATKIHEKPFAREVKEMVEGFLSCGKDVAEIVWDKSRFKHVRSAYTMIRAETIEMKETIKISIRGDKLYIIKIWE